MLAALAQTELIATIAVSLTAALALGVLARKLRLSPIVGYMLAGILVGPHTPGFVADQHLAEQLAEIGIALLMFGVGLHFSVADLLAVKRVAIPGAIGQSLLATVFGVGVAWSCGWGLSAGLVFGLALAVASTVVLVRGLQDLRQLNSVHGHVAVGWLVVEDLMTVLILVALPALAVGEGGESGGLWLSLGTTALKILGLGVLYVVGTKVVPWFLQHTAKLQSRELFTLAVLGIALGVAYGSAVAFSVSMALGAFLGGMIVGQSELSHQAAADALPLRDAFAVLFFVSVGMLFDPAFVLARPLLVLATLGIILVVKPVTALVITLLVGYPIRTGVTVAAGLAQIGEFSFIVGGLGKSLGMLPEDAYQAIVVAALLSIAANPLLFAMVGPGEVLLRKVPGLSRWIADKPGDLAQPPKDAHGETHLRDHAIVCGHGRTGRVLGRLLRERQWPLLVIDQDRATVQALRREGIAAIHGDAANPFVLERTALQRARILIVTLEDPLATRQIVEHARREAPELEIVARVQTEAERHHLSRLGHAEGVLAEQELAVEMARHVLQRFGIGQLEAQAVALDLRRGVFAPRDGARVLEVRIAPDSKAAGRPLAEVALGKGILVMAIDRRGDLLVPDGQTRLEVGDLVLLITSRELTEHAKAAL